MEEVTVPTLIVNKDDTNVVCINPESTFNKGIVFQRIMLDDGSYTSIVSIDIKKIQGTKISQITLD